MQNFLKKIEEIESTFQTTDEKIRTELRGTTEALAGARERAESLQTKYRVALAKSTPDATKLRVELTVAQDTVGLLSEMASQLETELKTGEIIEAQLRRHEAIASAVETEGNHAIHAAIKAAEAARDAYREALTEMVRVQHAVAQAGRKSYATTAKCGRPLNVPQVARYSASEFPVAEPEPSASTAAFM